MEKWEWTEVEKTRYCYGAISFTRVTLIKNLPGGMLVRTISAYDGANVLSSDKPAVSEALVWVPTNELK